MNGHSQLWESDTGAARDIISELQFKDMRDDQDTKFMRDDQDTKFGYHQFKQDCMHLVVRKA